MRKNVSRTVLSIILISAFVLFLSTVLIVNKNPDSEGGIEKSHHRVQNHENEQKGMIEEYAWLAQDGFVRLSTGNAEMINGIILLGDIIYYIYVEYIEHPIIQGHVENYRTEKVFSPVMQIKGINQTGIVVESITIPTVQGDFYVIGFSINYESEFIIIAQCFNWEQEKGILYYFKYNIDSGLLVKKELKQTGAEWIALEAHIEKNGAVAVIGIDSHYNGTVIIWDNNMLYISEKPITSDAFVFSYDGTYFYIENGNSTVLRERNILTDEIINEYQLPHLDIISIHLAEVNNGYDIYIVTAQYIYGYTIANNKKEHILNFIESQINIYAFSHIAFTADGRIVINQDKPNLEMNSWYVELAILSPVHRRVLADRDYIILAGFQLRPRFVDEVLSFNQRSSEAQIILRDYWEIDDEIGFRQAIERFHFDLIAGNVPDIILFEHPDDFILTRVRETLVRQGILLDLYQLIDTDPELKREDFFQHIIKGFEDKNGQLPVIGNWLTITSMITLNSTTQTRSWTFDDFLTMMELSIAAGNLEPLGNVLTGTRFLTTVLEFIDNDFIDITSGVSHFDNENFIRLLMLASSIPENHTFSNWGINYFPDFNALMNGKQTIDIVGFGGVYGLTGITSNSSTTPPFEYIGFPGTLGTTHNIQIWGTYSIFSTSQHIDVAWKFVREALMPGSTENIALTLRTDDFENRIETSTMTALEKEVMRNLISQATVHRPMSGTIIQIIEEEFAALQRGLREAEDVARIIQNRVQRYLSEQS